MTIQLSLMIGEYRAHENDRDAAVIAGDAEALRVCAAWPRITMRWKRTPYKPKYNELSNNAHWLWLWRGCEYDLQQLAQAVQLSERKTLKALRACVIARLIYPDGTISSAATTAIDGRSSKGKAR